MVPLPSISLDNDIILLGCGGRLPGFDDWQAGRFCRFLLLVCTMLPLPSISLDDDIIKLGC